MSAKDFLDLAEKFKFTNNVGFDDGADRMSFIYSVTLFMLSSIIVTFKTYIFQPMACYIPTAPSGLKFDDYVDNFCWVEGTYAFGPNNTYPQTALEWTNAEHLKINYYQWVPFILGLQCVFFYLPRVLWQTFCYNRVGIDLEFMLLEANKARNDDKCDAKAKSIAEKIKKLLCYHRDYRDGTVSNFRRKLFAYLGFFVASKRLGTWLVFWYLMVKVAYLVNALGQMFLIAKFFQTSSNFLMFGNDIVSKIISGRDWRNSMAFPRVTSCYIDSIYGIGVKNSFQAECSLPQNMINEKLFLFLWFWVMIVAISTIVGIVMLFKRVMFYNRVQFIKKLLKNTDHYQTSKRTILHKFVNEFLQHEGFLIVHMIYLNSGDIVTSSVVAHLFQMYEDNYQEVDLKRDRYYATDDEAMSMKLSHRSSTVVKKCPTAPSETVIQFV